MTADQHVLLVVEDDPATRAAMTVVLEGTGFKVVSAANGQEALDHLQEHRSPCLILLDLMMPVMDGWQFRDRQRDDPTLAGIPVVVVSADGNVGQKAEALGAVAYLQKPIEVEQLIRMVQQY